MVALLNAGRLQDAKQLALGDTRIEDLWINDFAISANPTTTEMVVHDRGPIWDAVRARISLPEILPPFVRGIAPARRRQGHETGPGRLLRLHWISCFAVLAFT